MNLDEQFDEQKLIKTVLRNDLASFVRKSFKTINFGETYLNNWHIDCICEYLHAIELNQIRKLNINISPRTMKSDICSVAFPMFLLGKAPSMKILVNSYSAKLSQTFHNKARMIASTSWFQHCFPEFCINSKDSHVKDTQTEFITTEGGYRIATSTGGSVTGLGGDIIICDDGMNPEEAFSETKRESGLTWFSQGLFSRLNNPKTGKFLNIQQRLHEDDFTGRFCLSEESEWVNLIIPIYFERDKIYSFGKFEKKIKAGEYMHEERVGEREVKNYKKEMGSYVFAGQYMQSPAPFGGGIIKEKWFKYYTIFPEMEYREIFADTAMKEKERNDYSVLECWGKSKDGKPYLIDLLRGKWEAPELLRRVTMFWNKHNAISNGKLRTLVVEDKTSGTGLIQTIKNGIKDKNGNIQRIPVRGIIPDKDKITRVMGVVGYIESGYVHIKKNAPWLSDFIHECTMFPSGTHDDQVDPMVYAIDSMLVRKPVTPRVLGTLG